jgi:hypothetical protein
MPDVAPILKMFPRLLAHRSKISAGVWELIWLLLHVTACEPDGNGGSVGVVDDGKPVTTLRVATELGRSREATLVNLGKLEGGNYILRAAAPGHAYTYRVWLRATVSCR